MNESNILKKIYNKIFRSFRGKTVAVAISGLFVAMFLMIVVSYKGIQLMSKSSLESFEETLDTVTLEYMENYITTSASFMEEEMHNVFNEQSILSAITQQYFDLKEEFFELNRLIVDMAFFKDQVDFNGRWYINDSLEPSVLLVQRYLLDGQNKIRPEVQELINETVIMDLLLPAFKNQGVSKEWVYYTGPKNQSFLRAAPWVDIGTAIDQVYPEHTDEPNWEYFNPGLVEAWEKYLRNHPELKNNLNELAIVSEPSQDGGTGEMIITLRQPIWNETREQMMGSVNYDVSLNATLSKVEEIRLGNSGFAFLVDRHDDVVVINERGMKILGLENVSVSDEEIGYNRLNRKLSDSIYDSVREMSFPANGETEYKEMIIENEAYIVIEKQFDVGLAYEQNTGIIENIWTLGFVVPKEEFYSAFHLAEKSVLENTHRVVTYQMLLAFVTLILIAGIIYDFNKGATRDLEKLLQVTEEIKKKNYDIEIDIHSSDEFGRLAVGFKSMIEEIKVTVQQLFEQNQLFREEIDERKRKERIIDYLESYDALTNLPNISVFMRTIDEQVQMSRGSGKMGAVLIIGMDNFRNVNEVYSHDVGDATLKAIAERLNTRAENAVMLSKLNGDEFGLIMNHLTDLQELVVVVEQIVELFKDSFKIDKKEIFLTVSVGVSTFPADGLDSQTLFKSASSALVNAKEIGRSTYKFFDNEMNFEAKEKLEMLTDLRHAIEGEEFLLHYQPIVDVKTSLWVGMEALIRWENPKRGIVPPIKFIPLAEESNLIDEITNWVIKKACQDLKMIHDMGYEEFKVSVNISPSKLKEKNFVEEVTELLSDLNIPPTTLTLEITEGVFIDNFEETAELFRRLRQFGVKIAVDDFGTGYSSLSYIKKLPVNCLKIDQSFIRGYPSTDDGTIANIINNLAKDLNLKVVAEGVEIIEQLDFLKERNVDEAQGYYFSVPVSIEKMSKQLRQHYKM